MRKVFSVMLVIAMLFSLGISASAAGLTSEAENEIDPQYVALSMLDPTIKFS